MKRIACKILLCLIAMLLSISVAKAEEWDCKTTNDKLTTDKPYIELDMRWFDWYGKNSYMKSCVISFSGYDDEIELRDLCTSDSDDASKIKDYNGTYKTYKRNNFFVELWDPHAEKGDRYSYRVTIRILPRFPIEKDTKIQGKVTVKWVDNHDEEKEHQSCKFTANVEDKTVFQDLGVIERDSYRLKYYNNSLNNIKSKFSGYERKLTITANNKETSFKIPDENTSYSTEVSLESNKTSYEVTETISLENNSYYLGNESHKVSFISQNLNTYKGYAYPTSITAEPDKWNKSVKLKWTKYSEKLSTQGTWRIIRTKERTGEEATLIDGLNFGNVTYVDTDTDFDTIYTYTVVFIPSTWDGTACADLSCNTSKTIIEKDFEIKLETVPAEDYITLSWTHEPLSGSGNYSYKVLRRVNDEENWETLKEVTNLSRNVTKYSYKDTKIGSSCDVNHYKIEMIALNNEIFYSNETNGKITGTSKVTSFSASRGDYSGIVKLIWNVEQFGTDNTKFKLYRQLLGSDSSAEWKVIHETEGVYSVYSYDDITADIGQYYRYRLVVRAKCDDGEYDSGMEFYTDGFSLATGIISGRVTYGTGTAVEGVKVAAIKASDDDNSNEQFYSLAVDKVGGIATGMSGETAKNIFGKDFSIQTWINLDTVYGNNIEIEEPIITQIPNMFRLTAIKQERNGFKLNITTFDGNKMVENTSDIIINADKFYHLTLSYNKQTNNFTLYAISDTIVSDIIKINETLDITKSIIDTASLDRSRLEHLREYHDETMIAFAACMQDSTNYYFKGYIDDIRVWNKTLTLEEVKKNYDHVLAGTEKNLKIYYPLDEGINKQETAYDYSKTDGVSNSFHGEIIKGTKVSSYHSSQMGLHAYTDTTGNYTIRGIPFRGSGVNYNVVPVLGIHEFSPSVDARYVSSSSPNFSGVNFEDVSSFPVSGVVYYENTTYPVVGASLYVDNVMAVKDNKPVLTNSNGEFTISVPIGDHFITVKYNKHTFVDNGRYPADPDSIGTKFTFDREIKDLTFYDNTKAMFAGRVTGGDIEYRKPLGGGVSKANIGQAKITFSTPYKMNVKKVTEGGAVRYITNTDTLYYNTENAPYVNSRAFAGNTEETVNIITIFTDPATGEFAVELPPVEYTVDSAKVLTNREIIFSELPTFVKPSNELVDYRDTSYVEKVFLDTIYGNNDTIINSIEKEETVDVRPFKYNASLLLSHRNEPIFNVSEYENNIFGIDTAYCVEPDGTKTPVVLYKLNENNEVEYIYDHPVYETYGLYSYDIMAYEEYVNYDREIPEYDRVPLVGTVVKIQNEFAAGNTISTQGDNDGEIVDLAENEIVLDSTGYARYEFMGGAPNITEPYTLSLNMNYEVNGRNYDWDRNGDFKAIILGDLPTGNNFVTTGPDLVQMILRDPPGSNSYSYWKSGSTSTNTKQLGGSAFAGTDLKVNIGLGTDATIATGAPGFYTIKDFAYRQQHIPGFDLKFNFIGHDKEVISWTATETISTSSSPDLVGAEGDVFIGSSTNIIFGDAREVGFHRDKNTNQIVLNMENCTVMGEEFTTGFNYTQNYIESTLIPNTIKLRNELLLPVGTTGLIPKNDTIYYISKLPTTDPKYGTSNNDTLTWGKLATTNSTDYNSYTLVEGPSYDILYDHNFYNNQESENGKGKILLQDQVNFYNQSVDNWKNILKENEKDKINAIEDEREPKNISVDGGVVYESEYTKNNIDGSDYHIDFTLDFFSDRNFGISANEAKGIVIEHAINIGGGGDFYWDETTDSIDTKGYVIDVGGSGDALSIDIYEKEDCSAIFRTRGGQTSCPYEDAVVTKYYQTGTVISEATMRVEYPQITADVTMLSNVPSGSAAIFNINLANISESNSDGWYDLSVVDKSNPDGALVSVDNLSIATGRPIFLEAGTPMKKQLTIRQTDLSILDYEDIKVVLSSQCQNDPSGTYGAVADTLTFTVHFVPSCSPIDIHIDNRVLNNNSPELTVRVDGYDLNYSSLKGIDIQIKGERDNNWMTLKSYITDTLNVAQDVELLTSSEIIYIDALTNLSDQNYLVRAITLCEYGEETINNESEEILITKDLSAPTLIATPNPADGIFNAGDEVSILFNEDVKSSEINEVDNIYVKGILNSSEVAHSVALATNASHPAKTESLIDLNALSFTVEMWLKYSSEGTVFSHGMSTNKFIASVDNNGYLNISVNDKVFKSLSTMPKDKWTYLAVAVDQTQGFASISAVCAYDEYVVDLFIDEKAPLYKGNGTLILGEGLDAAIHELTLWNYARNSSESLSDIYSSKSPFTAGLIGYWKLDEGHGTIGNDCVRNRHLTVSGTNSWYLENENKAVEIEDNEYIAMNVAYCPTDVDDDYLVEFWFKGETQETTATILSMFNNINGFDLRFDSNGNLELETSYGVFKSSNKSLDGSWHHLAINVLKANHGSAIIYVDGVNVIQIEADKFPAIQASELIFGARHTRQNGLTEYAQFFEGAFDEIRYWKGTYTAEYIKNNMYSRVAAGEAGLMAYYPMEEMSVDNYNQIVYSASPYDQSGNESVENEKINVYKLDVTTQIFTAEEPQWTDNTPPLKVAPAYDNVDVSFVASERKILININEDPKNIEGCTLIFNVSGVRDVNDNMMNPVTWSAYVRQNQLNWNVSNVDIRKHSSEKEYFSAKIHNASGSTEYWSIQNMPSWLDADIESGDLAPLSEVTVNFTISDAAPVGRHETILYLSGNNSIPEPLILNLVCEGYVPDWNVNPNNFMSSMNMVAQFKIDGHVSDNPDDVVAAFINDRCVGKASPVYNSRYDAYYLMMNIYGNYVNENGNIITTEDAEIKFKAYSASTGIIYPTVKASETMKFVADNIVGELGNPVILYPVDEVQQSISLVKGWSWISINVEPEDNSIATMMKPVAGNVSYVKSKNNFASIDNAGKWHGVLTEISHSKMYKVNANSAVDFNVVGKQVNVNEDTIVINNGWNWIGYTPSSIMSVGNALVNVNPLDGDIIKSRDGFSVYDGYEWIGTLVSMQPGNGYVYKSTDYETKTFTYQSVVRSNEVRENIVSHFPSAYEYPDNMNVIAQVKDGELVIENAVVEVFANKSLRGISEQTVVDNKHFLTIYGNSSDERLSFVVTVDGNKYEIDETFNFREDAVVGTLNEPYVIQLADIENNIKIYPTLVKDVINITSEDKMSSVTIHSVSGVKVYHSEERDYSMQIDMSDFSDGTYIVTVITENGDVEITYIVKG